MSGTESGDSSLIVAVRWVAVVPAALVSDIFFDSVFMHIARLNLGHLRLVHDLEGLLSLFSGAVGTLAFILFGALVAPHFRGIVALVLLVLEAIAGALFAGLMIGGALPRQTLLAAGMNVDGYFLGAAAGLFVVFTNAKLRQDQAVNHAWVEENEIVHDVSIGRNGI